MSVVTAVIVKVYTIEICAIRNQRAYHPKIDDDASNGTRTVFGKYQVDGSKFP